MTTPTNHWKLGLFVVVGAGCALAFLIWLGSQSFRKQTVRYVSYFDEPVTGLDIGSPVSFRGVRIGNVEDIDIAPDRRHVEVAYDLQVEEIEHMGLAKTHGKHVELRVPDDVRVQISSSGVTGVKHIKLDYLKNSPVKQLPFPVPENYIPASPSTLKNLEDAVTQALDNLPAVVEKALAVLSRTEAVIASVQDAALPEQTSALIARASNTVSVVEGKVAGVDTVGISQKANQALGQLNEVLARANNVAKRMESDEGLLRSVQRATDAMGDVAANARGTGPKLDQTLEHVSDVA
ncbi:MAG TPA: MlaD family protein, partial [Polyangiales bacterium]|nr:MlaD family protein [Polyangiales bacterium]